MSTGGDYGSPSRQVSLAWSRSLSSFYPTNTLNGRHRLTCMGGRVGATIRSYWDIERERLVQQRMVAFFNAQCCGLVLSTRSTGLGTFAQHAVPQGPALQPRLHPGRPRHVLELLRELRRRPWPGRSGPVRWSPAPPGSSAGTCCRCLTGNGAVVGWHRPGSSAPEASGVTWRAVELRDRDAVAAALAADPPDAIYHCAGVAHVGDSWAQAEETLASNAIGTAHLVDALRWTRASSTHAGDRLGDDLQGLGRAPHRGLAVGAEHAVRHQQAGAGDGGARGMARARHSGGGHPLVQPHRPAAVPGLRRRQLRAPAGDDRSRASPRRPCRSATSPPLRDVSDVRDTVRAYVALMAPAVRASPTTSARAGRSSMQALLDGLRARVRVPVTVVSRPGADAPGRYAGDRRQPRAPHRPTPAGRRH